MGDSGNWFDQGVTLLEGGDFTGAINAFDKAITFNQSVKDAWFNRGVACAQIGKYQQALHSFDQTILIDPDHENAKKARTMVLALWEKQKKSNLLKDEETPLQRSYVSVPASPKTVSNPEKELIRSPLFAVLFSFIFPGWGQWYNGERWKGLIFVAVSFFSAILNIGLTIILKGNLLVSVFFTVLGLGIIIYGMYDAYITAQRINAREIGFTRKSRLFWLPVILLAVMIVMLIIAMAFAFMVLGMAAGNIQQTGGNTLYTGSSVHHTKVVAATAQQSDASHIDVTYQGGQDANQVSQIIIMVTDSKGSLQTKTLGQSGDTTPIVIGSKAILTGTPEKDHVVATARFTDGTDQVILDTYV